MEGGSNGWIGLRQKRKRYLSVEPVLFLYMSAFMITSVVEEAFFVHKACLVNLGFEEAICLNISKPEYFEFKKKVQVEVSSFHQWENVASNLFPLILAFFLGAWSDRVGRKIPLMLGLAGSAFYSFMIIINAIKDDWRLEVVLVSACLPCALTGGNLTVFMAAFSYLADTTSQEDRTLRTTLLEVAYLLPMPLGVFVGSYLFNVVGHSYAWMFAINLAFLLLALLYTILFIDWKTVDSEDVGLKGISKRDLLGLVNLNHVVESIKSLFKKRPEKRRSYLFLILLAMSLYTFQRDEKHMLYLYSQLKFNWDVSTFSKFRTFQSSLFVAGLLIIAPILNKILKLKDTYTIMLGAVSHIAARMFFIFAQIPSILYVGGGVGLLGPIVAPVLRSVTSKLVPASERGKIFAIFSISDTTVPLISGVIYSQVYNHTIGTFPQSVFVVTAISQGLVFLITLFIHVMVKGKNIEQAEEKNLMIGGSDNENESLPSS